MNTDIRLSVGFWEHPKTIKLIRRLGLGGVRSLQILWLWATQNRPDGMLSGMDDEDIEIAAKWDGEPTALYRVLTELGFVDTIHASDGSGQVVNSLHGWAEHNSWQAESETRSGENRLKRLARSYPDVHKALLEAGCKTLTGEEYQLIQRLYHGSTTVSTIVVQISTARSTPFLTSPCLSSPNPEEKKSIANLESIAKSKSSANQVSSASEPPSALPDAGQSPEKSFYLTKRKRKLTGKRLETFNRFWTAFAYPKGKAEAADAWLDIPQLTDSLVEQIVAAAEMEAAARPGLVASGHTPKWAQGWISGKRWEDEPAMPVMEKTLDELLAEKGITQ